MGLDRLRWAIPCHAAMLCSVLPAAAESVRYALEPHATFVHVEVMHFDTSTIRGRFGPIPGDVILDRAGSRGRLGLTIRTDSVDFGIPLFNARARADDLLSSTTFPEAYFVSEHFHFEGDQLREVRGEFTLRGVSQPLSLRALRFGCRGEPLPGVEVCGGDFEGELLRSEYGVDFGLPWVANRVRLQVQVEGIRR